MSQVTCQRTIKRVGTEFGWSPNGYDRGKCGRKATCQQDDGLPLCRKHYNRWLRKKLKNNPPATTLPGPSNTEVLTVEDV